MKQVRAVTKLSFSVQQQRAQEVLLQIQPCWHTSVSYWPGCAGRAVGTLQEKNGWPTNDQKATIVLLSPVTWLCKRTRSNPKGDQILHKLLKNHPLVCLSSCCRWKALLRNTHTKLTRSISASKTRNVDSKEQWSSYSFQVSFSCTCKLDAVKNPSGKHWHV